MEFARNVKACRTMTHFHSPAKRFSSHEARIRGLKGASGRLYFRSVSVFSLRSEKTLAVLVRQHQFLYEMYIILLYKIGHLCVVSYNCVCNYANFLHLSPFYFYIDGTRVFQLQRNQENKNNKFHRLIVVSLSKMYIIYTIK